MKVLKFGGSVLRSGEDYVAASRVILNARKSSPVVAVVSAPYGRTDWLAEAASASGLEGEERERLLVSGEAESGVLLAGALGKGGAESIVIAPGSLLWPLFLDEEGGLDEELLKERAVLIAESARQKVVVMPGFTALKNGKVVSLPRGGSDLTAALLAWSLGAGELVLYKDAGGVKSGDPAGGDTVELSLIDRRSLDLLSRSGAKVVSHTALPYLGRIENIRVSGVDGTTGTELQTPDEGVDVASGLAAVVVVGKGFLSRVGLLAKLVSPARESGTPLLDVTVNDRTIALYVDAGHLPRVEPALRAAVNEDAGMQSYSVKSPLSRISISDEGFIEQPGVVAAVAQALAKESINLWEMVTLHTDITLYLEAKETGRALEAIKRITEDRALTDRHTHPHY